MEIQTFDIEGLVLFTPKIHKDSRGIFLENYQLKNFVGILSETFTQDNLSRSLKGVLRGLHFQSPPHAQGKLVQVLKGSVLDVAVDIRAQSPTYGEYVSVELNGEEFKQFYIPPGFAHGFIALEDDTIFQYKCTNYYAPTHENTLLWNDKHLNIDWGLLNPIVSNKDQMGFAFSSFKSPF